MSELVSQTYRMQEEGLFLGGWATSLARSFRSFIVAAANNCLTGVNHGTGSRIGTTMPRVEVSPHIALLFSNVIALAGDCDSVCFAGRLDDGKIRTFLKSRSCIVQASLVNEYRSRCVSSSPLSSPMRTLTLFFFFETRSSRLGAMTGDGDNHEES